MMWALIVNGVVHELTGDDPNGRFHSALMWVPCEASVMLGWLYIDGTFSAPAVPTTSTNDIIRSQIATLEATVSDRRYREAVLGIDGGWLKDLDDKINELRAMLK